MGAAAEQAVIEFLRRRYASADRSGDDRPRPAFGPSSTG